MIANGDLNAWTEEMMRLPLACNGCALKCANRLMLGAYSYWLEKWLKQAGPKQFTVVFLNEYMLNPTSVLAKIQEAWGLSDNNPARARILAQKNSSGDTAAQLNVHVHRQALTEENRAALELWYKPWNCRLAALLDSTGIRGWDSTLAATTGWIPTRSACRSMPQNP